MTRGRVARNVEPQRSASLQVERRGPKTFMNRLFCTLIAVICAAANAVNTAHAAETGEGAKFFEVEVRPILANRCYECHGEKKQKGGLRVDGIGFLKAGGDTGPALVAGDPDKSPIIEAVRYHNADFQMPPKGALPSVEVAALEKWVKMGAPWPQTDAQATTVLEGGFTAEQRAYWFFQPLAKVSPPQLDSNWVRGDIDRFILKKQREAGVDPAPEADRAELVRRVYFDLHGLPPQSEEAARFIADEAPDAYERLVDSLLASPRYGQRWAQHWLDLVRYAESDGYNEDAYRPAAWRYRDWVIESFNRDKPYDQFLTEQIAGDEINSGDPNVLIATAYLRNPVYEWNQRDVRGQWEIILTDITDTTGEVFLGLSFGCARCHNHKFDPILQKDYFRLKSFFASVLWRDDMTLATAAERDQHRAKQAAWESATQEIRAKMDALLEGARNGAEARALKMFTDELQEMVRKPAADRDAIETQLAGLCQRQITRAGRGVDAQKNLKKEEEKQAYKALEEQLKAFDSMKPEPLPEAFVATDTGPSAAPTTMKTRKGSQEIAPGFLSILDPREATIEPVGNSTGRRLALAKWMTRPDNPLSTRVIVNRVWQYHFGRGIVASANDFGKLGEKPSHPELLDWLAARFSAEGWSFKKLHREILLSAVYRQTARRQPTDFLSKTDPSNRLLWRFNPRRLDAEQVRDAMLAASGELDLRDGGPPEEGTSLVRSIFTKKKRNRPTEILQSLDMPAGFTSTAERQSTTTPTQALLLLNGEWSMARARKLGEQVGTVEEAWMRVLGRLPSVRERAMLEQHLGGSYSVAPGDGAASPVLAVRPGEFREKSPQERLLVAAERKEEDDFTVEAYVSLDSVDVNASVRTIASRWTGAKDSVEGYGWSLGVTGMKSRYSPQTVIVQLAGEDENANSGYEVVTSKIKIELGRRYHVAATVSCQEHRVVFRIQDVSEPGLPVQTASVAHSIRSKLSSGSAGLVFGGLHRRQPAHQWDGFIYAARVFHEPLDDAAWKLPVESWGRGVARWSAVAAGAEAPGVQWSGLEVHGVDSADPRRKAMHDLCQVLLNTNEFFYLH